LFAVTLFFTSCDAIKDATQFDISYTLPDQEVNVDTTTFSASGVEQLVAEGTVTINLDSLKQAHDLEGFEAAEFDYVKLELLTPQDIDLNWIQSIRATVSTPTIAETDVATYTKASQVSNVIDIQVADVAVLDYMMQSTFTIKIYAKATLPLPAPQIDMLLKSKLKITVQPI